VPSATEMIHALGLGHDLVGVTHECDYPPEAADLPHLTRSVLPEGLTAAEIDRQVRERTEKGEAIYELDRAALERLQPDLIVTQAVCEVCAVSFDDVANVAEQISSQPMVLSLDPTTVGEVLADIRTLAMAADVPEAGERLLAELADRIDAVEAAVEGADPPRVAALEWLDPVFAGGHWVPQLIEMAGGVDVLGLPGEKSRVVDWAEVQGGAPEVVVSMPCGYDAEVAAAETRERIDRIAELRPRHVVAVDASAYFSRPGPRLVDGLELLAHVLHPDRVAAPPPGRFVPLDAELAEVVG
jgi:iron complex transport system substrate-binding protein